MIPSVVDTLIIDGAEVRVTPASFDVQRVIPAKNIVKLPCGPVEIRWPGQEVSTLTLNASYPNLDDEDAEAILVLSTQNTEPAHTLRFSKSGQLYQVKTLRCELQESPRGWTVNLTGLMNWMAL